jgi:hypothetical protein
METPQKPKNRAFIVLIVLVIVFVEIFLLLDFHLLSGNANSSSQVSTYDLGMEEVNQFPMNPNLDLYVLGNSRLESRLAKALPDALRGNIIANTIEISDGTPQASENSVLVIEVTKPSMLWTPFYGQADIEFTVAYASDGEVDWIDEQSVDLIESPVFRLRGDYQMSANVYGLMSLPGFRSYLADKLAEQIGSSLRERLTSPNP